MNSFDQIRQWAEDRNLIKGSAPEKQFLKLTEELGEVAECIAKNLHVDELKKEIGDMMVVLTILAAQHGLDASECAAAAYDKIKDRKGRMVGGVFVKEEDL